MCKAHSKVTHIKQQIYFYHLKDLFDTTEAHKIIDFIKETRFYKQL